MKQRRQLGRGRRHLVRIRNLDVDQLLERAIAPIWGKILHLALARRGTWSRLSCIKSDTMGTARLRGNSQAPIAGALWVSDQHGRLTA